MSSRELIQRIREKSELNRAVAGDESAATGTSPPDLLHDIQEQVSRELARRVDATLERFSQRLDRLPASPAPTLATDEVNDRLGRIQDSVRDLVTRLDRFAGELEAHDDAPAMSTADLRQQLEEWWRDCELERSAAASRAAAEAEPATATERDGVANADAIERLAESLDTRFEELRSRLEERLGTLQVSVDASAARAGHESDDAEAASQDEALIGVRDSLETLQSMWSEFMARIESADSDSVDSEAADPASSEWDLAESLDALRDSVRDEVQALERRLAERIASAIESASVDPQPMAIDLDLSALDDVKSALESWETQWREWIAKSDPGNVEAGTGAFDPNELRRALVEEFQSIEERLGDRVCNQLLEQLASRIDERLARLEPASTDDSATAFDPSSLDPLTAAIEKLEARWDDFVRASEANGSADPVAVDPNEWRDAIVAELSGLETRLGEKWQERAAAGRTDTDDDSADDSADDEWRARLDELQSRLDARFDALGENWDERWQALDDASRSEDASPSASSEEILGRLDRLEEALSQRIAEARQWLADNATEGDREAEADREGSAFAELHELEERLNSAVIALTQHAEAGRLAAGQGGIDEETLDRWEARIIDAIQNGPVATAPIEQPAPAAAPADAPVSESLLFARLESLEESVQAFVTRSGETLTQTILDRCLELEHTVPEQVSERVGGIASSEAPALELPDALLQMPDVVIGLRRDFSLLVHTVNNHLEDAREQVDRIADAVIEKLRENPDLLSAGGATGADEGNADLDDQVEEALDAHPSAAAPDPGSHAVSEPPTENA